MKHILGGLLVCLLCTSAQAQVEVKPEFMMIIDTSGSMTTSTGGGNNACGYTHTRMHDANCAFRRIVDSSGDAIFGLEKFATQTCSGTCNWANSNPGCVATAAAGVILGGIVDQNQSTLIPWVDNVCNNCTTAGNPELTAAGNTPLEGSLRAAQAYYQGQVAGFTSPMVGDSFAACRPHYVILLTDGDETCGGTPANAATALHNTVVAGVGTFDVKTFVIGFGQTSCYGPLEAIATAGNTTSGIPCGNAPGTTARAFYATDEQSVSLALSQIIQSSLLVEKCNNVDDNCNNIIDEGFDKGAACSVGVGACRRTGTKICGCAPGDATCDPTLGVIGRGPNGTICADAMGNPLVPGTPGTETCPNNGIDDDCNGVVDDVPGGCPTATPEVCNGLDDDRDGIIDEWKELFPCQQATGPFSPNCMCISGTGQVTATCPASGALPDNCGCLPACGSSVGICRPGLDECLNGVLTCVGGTGPAAETCNCLDDNCNGVVDDVPPVSCYTGPAGTSGVGVCRPGQTQCQCSGGVATTNCVGQVTPGPEIACNGLDDNCNGVVDEPQGQPCYPNGVSGCVDAGGGSFTCTGVCQTGTFQCQGGQLRCVGATTPSAEICDGLDNNCDGMVDNFVCGTAQGICTARCTNPNVPGSTSCTAGQPCSCNTRFGAGTETCNGQDDDCDGIIDNNLGQPFGNACPPAGATCNLQVGTCCGICTLGTIRCLGGQQVCDGATGPRPEICNGIDDDCNCAIDDNVPGFGQSCGSSVGACRTGTFQCAMGMPQCIGATGPMTEVCNNIDDDCDGVVDDNIPGTGNPCYDAGPSSNCNLTANPPRCNGQCRPGQLVCNGAAGQMQCQGQIGPSPEICNGLDDDCNGIVDDGFNVGGVCTIQVGTCSTTGHLVCNNNGSGTFCNAPPPVSSPEICDGQDNNCNGIVDEPWAIWPCPTSAPNPAGCICPAGLSCGNIGDLAMCSCPPQCGFGVGECQPGHLTCANGQQMCVGGTQPQPELCNCLDDNCNGIVDDNPMGEGDPCPPIDPNHTCNSAGVGCRADEQCNAATGACQVTNVGPPAVCRNGHKHCTDMGSTCGFVCEGAVGPSPEICDGLDNDCDGMVDNGATCPPMYACISGTCQPQCQQSEFPCTADRRCIDPTTGSQCDPPRSNCVCLPNLCANASCNLATQDCIIQNGMAVCRDRCPPNKCPAPQTCDPATGMCQDCFTTGCPTGQVCTGNPGNCVPDPCATVTCGPGEFCRDGNCVSSCPAGCPQGQVCVDGMCKMSRCDGVVCTPDQICNPSTGMCVPNLCLAGCPMGENCIPSSGMCVPDPCATVHCQTCFACSLDFDGNAQCNPESGCSPPPSLTATTAGGGGCACELARGGNDTSPLGLLLAALALVLAKRSRR